MALFVVRVDRNADKIEEFEKIVADFLKEVDEKVANLRAVYLEGRSLAAEQLRASVNLLEAS
jgi:phage-related minor tail protein